MAAATSDKYALYLLHLLIGVMNEEMSELTRYGIPPIGVGHVMPLKKDSREKILDLLIKIDGIIKEAALKMIEDTVVLKKNKDEMNEWIRAMLEELKTRAASLSGIYGDEMQKVVVLLHEINEILDIDVEEKTEFPEKKFGNEKK
jgi:hypothetical protein